MGNGTRSSAGRPGGGPGRLPTHRLVLAMALLSTAPPLVIHEGWRGVLVAVAAVIYAAYLLLGKRWPRLRRRRAVSPTRPGRVPAPPGAPRAGAQPAEAVRADAPPAETPRAETPPAEASRAETPPAEASRAETRPAEASRAEARPAEASRAETRPAEASRVETRPAEASRAEVLRSEAPAGTPPVEAAPPARGTRPKRLEHRPEH